MATANTPRASAQTEDLSAAIDGLGKSTEAWANYAEDRSREIRLLENKIAELTERLYRINQLTDEMDKNLKYSLPVIPARKLIKFNRKIRHAIYGEVRPQP